MDLCSSNPCCLRVNYIYMPFPTEYSLKFLKSGMMAYSFCVVVYLVSHFILEGSKITADGDCSHEMKRRLLLGRKVMTNLDSIFKSRDITWQQRSV